MDENSLRSSLRKKIFQIFYLWVAFLTKYFISNYRGFCENPKIGWKWFFSKVDLFVWGCREVDLMLGIDQLDSKWLPKSLVWSYFRMTPQFTECPHIVTHLREWNDSFHSGRWLTICGYLGYWGLILEYGHTSDLGSHLGSNWSIPNIKSTSQHPQTERSIFEKNHFHLNFRFSQKLL